MRDSHVILCLFTTYATLVKINYWRSLERQHFIPAVVGLDFAQN